MSSRTYRSTLVGVTALLGVAAGIPAATVEAKPQRPKLVTVSMTAVVEFVDDSLGVLCSDVAPGDVITATYTFDPLTPDTNPLDVVGDYFQQASGAGFRVDLGDAVTETDPGNIVFLVEVVNDYPGDYYVVRSYNNLPLSCGSTVSHIGWQLDDPTGTAFRSTDLSRKAPDLEDFVSFFGLDIEGQDYETGAYFRIRAHVVSAK